jgi:hypothetical protein
MQWSTEKGQTNIQLSIHPYTENNRLSNTNITKDRGWTEVWVTIKLTNIHCYRWVTRSAVITLSTVINIPMFESYTCMMKMKRVRWQHKLGDSWLELTTKNIMTCICRIVKWCLSETTNRRMADNAMVNRKRTNEHSIIYTSLHRK